MGQRRIALLMLVLGGLLAGTPLFGAGLLEQCLNQAPAGLALQDHLAKARSGNVESMWCAGARNAQEQQTLGFLRCPADPVGVTFRNSNERFAYLREKGKEFDRMEAEAARARAQQRTKSNATGYTECNEAGGTWHNPSSSCN